MKMSVLGVVNRAYIQIQPSNFQCPRLTTCWVSKVWYLHLLSKGDQKGYFKL